MPTWVSALALAPMMKRDALADRIIEALAVSCRGSRAQLRGSLRTGTADEYSDIDVEWLVPDGGLAGCLASVRATLERVQPVAAVRTAPDCFHSTRKRLLFVRFAEVSLFWRLDLAVREVGAGPCDPADHARDGEWSKPASALANALGAIKAVARGRYDDARGLLSRGCSRIDEIDVSTGSWVEGITRLARAAASREAELATLAEETISLAREELSGREES
ncbi:hypothetical protein A4R44_08432 [Amycolatopsis sp. M39]|nr:hypothetical protein A4R44_08432 [Amycolatopsis sp. M39]